MTGHPLYKITSIGRPVEPRYPTNKAVLVLLPAAAAVAVFFAWFVNGETLYSGLGGTALYSILVVFGSWALARELAPDDNPAAFISMALALLVYLLNPGASVLLLFVALALARILNRSTGLAPRLGDSVAVTLLAAWAAYSLDSPLIAAVAGIAFMLDAMLSGPEKRQWLFAVASVAVASILAVQQGSGLALPSMPVSVGGLIPALLLLAFMLAIFSMKSVEAEGDVDGKPLVLSRVRTGMAIVLMLAFVFIFALPGRTGLAVLLLASMAGIPAGLVLQNIRRFIR